MNLFVRLAALTALTAASALPASGAALLTAQEPGAAAPAFRFTADAFWLNLHQFLYVLGRARANAPDATRRAVAGAPADEERGLAAFPADEQAAWRLAVSTYQAGLSRLDTVWDKALVDVALTLSRAGDTPSLPSTFYGRRAAGDPPVRGGRLSQGVLAGPPRRERDMARLAAKGTRSPREDDPVVRHEGVRGAVAF